jgi:hypothetical protein
MVFDRRGKRIGVQSRVEGKFPKSGKEGDAAISSPFSALPTVPGCLVAFGLQLRDYIHVFLSERGL